MVEPKGDKNSDHPDLTLPVVDSSHSVAVVPDDAKDLFQDEESEMPEDFVTKNPRMFY